MLNDLHKNHIYATSGLMKIYRLCTLICIFFTGCCSLDNSCCSWCPCSPCCSVQQDEVKTAVHSICPIKCIALDENDDLPVDIKDKVTIIANYLKSSSISIIIATPNITIGEALKQLIVEEGIEPDRIEVKDDDILREKHEIYIHEYYDYSNII